MRILLLGKNGQIGWELQRTLAPLGELAAIDHPDIDLSSPDSIISVLRRYRPRLVVNAAGYTDVDRAEKEPELAMAVNGRAPGKIAEELKKTGGAIVHYSTDYVFDGEKEVPYVESDTPRPLSVYGRSKLEGEKAIVDSIANYLVFRTSWVYGVRGNNFLRTVLDLASRKEKIRVVEDQVGAPTWSRFLAEATAEVLHSALSGASSAMLSTRGGTYHLTAAGETSWYGFARRIIDLDPKKNEHSLRKVVPVSTDEYAAPARRPLNCRLDCSAIEKAFGIKRPGWDESLRSVMGELNK